MSKRSSYTFYLTGKKDNDAEVIRAIGNHNYMLFDFPYTAPYQQEFRAIKDFQDESRYIPFKDSNSKKKFAIINISEWIGHEDEEYLGIFVKFLHDYRSFFNYEYIFTVGEASREDIKDLYMLMAQYLRDGKIIEDYTLSDWKLLSGYIRRTYSVDSHVANRCAEIMTRCGVKGLPQVDLYMQDMIHKITKSGNRKLTEMELLSSKNIENTTFFIVYEDAVKDWKANKEFKYNDYEKMEDAV